MKNQLDEIRSKEQIRLLGEGGKTLIKAAILFIPIFISGDEDEVQPKGQDYVDSEVETRTLEKLVSKPDLIFYWLLPKESLQKNGKMMIIQ